MVLPAVDRAEHALDARSPLSLAVFLATRAPGSNSSMPLAELFEA
jgi:hypothetical protein